MDRFKIMVTVADSWKQELSDFIRLQSFRIINDDKNKKFSKDPYYDNFSNHELAIIIRLLKIKIWKFKKLENRHTTTSEKMLKSSIFAAKLVNIAVKKEPKI